MKVYLDTETGHVTLLLEETGDIKVESDRIVISLLNLTGMMLRSSRIVIPYCELDISFNPRSPLVLAFYTLQKRRVTVRKNEGWEPQEHHIRIGIPESLQLIGGTDENLS